METKIQEETDINNNLFCSNDTYNYAYDEVEWIYTIFPVLSYHMPKCMKKEKMNFSSSRILQNIYQNEKLSQ